MFCSVKCKVVHHSMMDGFLDSQKRPIERREGLTTMEILDNARGDAISAKRLFTLRVVRGCEYRLGGLLPS